MNKKLIASGRGWMLAVVLGSLGLWLPAAAQAQPVVESVTSQIQGGIEVVRIDFSQPLQAVPNGFAIQSPARVALDVPGATNGLGRNTVEINQGNIRSVNVVQAGERTRLVVNLKTAAAYRAQLQGKSLLVVFDPVVAAGPAPASPAAPGLA